MNMNKKMLFFALFALMLLLAACGGSGGNETGSTPADEETSDSGADGGEATGDAEGDDSEAAAEGSTLQAIKDRGKLVAGVKFDTRLFGLKNPQSGDVEGYDVDIMKLLAQHIFETDSADDVLELVQVNSKTRFELVDNGEIDLGAATATINAEREEIVDFTNVYFIAGQSLLVPEDSSITGIEDLTADTTVIAVKGSTSEKNIKEKAPDAKVDLYDDYAAAFTALRAGKGDTLTTDNAILLGMRETDPSFKLVGGLFTEEPYGIFLKDGDDEFREYVNEFLNGLKESGELDELYQKWFGEPAPENILYENEFLK
ncbi:transporter substrate-binding domain-containing protein [Aureibacillus halotolerans]|uniref:Amino acid ABC transporter substrate-binding protein (PAAT family) n=1 Tax=Aureibacillus halotolerans TaxID=1508390 RepID=A0A4R6U546_9BACI|nr:transporter substrate-binding domain-containing protein [Aureibacillus halotolerans]TDQ40856.1 amino acid ABC transporter substrate-binding protein (PAAT family) [Aureibacillus halotolerans]